MHHGLAEDLRSASGLTRITFVLLAFQHFSGEPAGQVVSQDRKQSAARLYWVETRSVSSQVGTHQRCDMCIAIDPSPENLFNGEWSADFVSQDLPPSFCSTDLALPLSPGRSIGTPSSNTTGDRQCPSPPPRSIPRKGLRQPPLRSPTPLPPCFPTISAHPRLGTRSAPTPTPPFPCLVQKQVLGYLRSVPRVLGGFTSLLPCSCPLPYPF